MLQGHAGGARRPSLEVERGSAGAGRDLSPRRLLRLKKVFRNNAARLLGLKPV
jgi:hypothetical protein